MANSDSQTELEQEPMYHLPLAPSLSDLYLDVPVAIVYCFLGVDGVITRRGVFSECQRKAPSASFSPALLTTGESSKSRLKPLSTQECIILRANAKADGETVARSVSPYPVRPIRLTLPVTVGVAEAGRREENCEEREGRHGLDLTPRHDTRNVVGVDEGGPNFYSRTTWDWDSCYSQSDPKPYSRDDRHPTTQHQ
ncbi:hypothetical protein K438DRAFT_1776479 [Mycena galopus ATCC 62051]|nr:hypothetical protein K438DRAFT_1776479 [Mycena galopus ATCC 62051]